MGMNRHDNSVAVNSTKALSLEERKFILKYEQLGIWVREEKKNEECMKRTDKEQAQKSPWPSHFPFFELNDLARFRT